MAPSIQPDSSSRLNGGDPAGADRDDEATELVRYAFQVPTLLVRRMKVMALQRDTTASDLLRQWIAEGLASVTSTEPASPLPSDGRTQQFPVNITRATRRALDDCAARLQISTAQLMRRWITNGTDPAMAEAEARGAPRSGPLAS